MAHRVVRVLLVLLNLFLGINAIIGGVWLGLREAGRKGIPPEQAQMLVAAGRLEFNQIRTNAGS